MDVPSSLQEYIENQDKLEQEARELFPYEFSVCSYDLGALKQQVFSCLTCAPESGERQRGGICYSCSISCHGEHTLVELFNKRNFRCDCGTSRCGNLPCVLAIGPSGGVLEGFEPGRRPANRDNRYNHNFEDKFCWCNEPYVPQQETGTMYQCINCEDWFHDRCIAKEEMLPEEEQFDEFLCRSCTETSPWLRRYRSDDKISATGEPYEPLTKRIRSEICCRWAQLQDEEGSRSLFLREGWRQHICSCEDCMEKRIAEKTFLLQEEEVWDPPEDVSIAGSDSEEHSSNAQRGSTVSASAATSSSAQRALEDTLSRMPRDRAIDSLLAFNSLKDHITACLRPLAERGEIVTADHVRTFFETAKRK
ncbi:hypothetical protein PYCC9005_005112 [Savitreella phatthalungensis]